MSQTHSFYAASCNGNAPIGAWTERADVEQFIVGRKAHCERLGHKIFDLPPLEDQVWEVVLVTVEEAPEPVTETPEHHFLGTEDPLMHYDEIEDLHIEQIEHEDP